MNKQSTLSVPVKFSLSILVGLISLLLCSYGIIVYIGAIKIDIPWSQLFPVLITLAFGWRYGLMAGICGGALFPFVLWPEDGWANATTSLEYLALFTALGAVNDGWLNTLIKRRTLRITLVVFVYIAINYLYDFLLFNSMLHLNPPFWTDQTVRYIDPEIILGFGYKDSINVITVVLAAETLLRLSFIRRLLAMPLVPAMAANNRIFIATLCIPILVWLAFIGLGDALLRENNALKFEHKSFALFVIFANGFLAARLLFYYSETQFFIQSRLNQSDKKYRAIFENVQDVFFQTDLNGLIHDISPSVQKLSGHRRTDLLNKNISILIADKETPLRYLAETKDITGHELGITTVDGIHKYASLNARLIQDDAENTFHIDGVLRDITERKNYELEIGKKNRDLEIKNRELEQFAHIASHDLQEPLQTLVNVSEILSAEFKDKENTQVNTYLDFIKQSSLRMQELVKGLLDYSRVGSGRKLSEVDSNEIVRNVLEDMSLSIGKSHAEIVVQQLPVLPAYSAELYLLFKYLISNAVKFVSDGVPPKIIISAQQTNQEWVFSIQDNGIGIEEKNKEKIFLIFKRLHNRNQYGGIGVGLSHSKKIVALHGGNIWVESNPGKGSTFKFSIPVK